MTNSNAQVSTPWHLWVIGVFLLLWQGMATFDYFATVFKYEPHLSKFPQEALDYYFAAPTWMFAMWGIGSIGGLIGAVLVLMRHKLAVPVFFVAWISGVVATAYSFINPPPNMEGAKMFGAVIVAASALVLFYLHTMRKKGVLR